MKLMDTLHRTTTIGIYPPQARCYEYRDASGNVPEFGSVNAANAYIDKHRLERASAVERFEPREDGSEA